MAVFAACSMEASARLHHLQRIAAHHGRAVGFGLSPAALSAHLGPPAQEHTTMSYPYPDQPPSRTDAITAAYAAGEPVESICARFGATTAEVEALVAGPAPDRKVGPSRRRWLIPAAVAGLVVVVAGTVAATVAATRPEQNAARPAAAADGQDPVTVPAVEDEVPTEAPGPVLSASDLVLTPKITSKHCFGSAGCNVNLKIKLGYSGEPLSEDDTWEITYEISGDEDGPVIGTLELTGTEFMSNEESLSTPSSRTKIRIKVTDVSKQGD